MKNNKQVYVYYDAETGELEVFTTLEAAKTHADKQLDCEVEEWWEEGNNHYQRGIDQHIYVRTPRLQ